MNWNKLKSSDGLSLLNKKERKVFKEDLNEYGVAYDEDYEDSFQKVNESQTS